VLAPDGLDLHPDARAGRYVVVSVVDTGHGIPPAVIDRIFEPFFTTKEIGKGTGLGLSTVLGIVKGHGGFVTVGSVMSQGTTFSVYLPAVTAEQEEYTPEAEAIPLGHNELVLVVDDEPNIGATTRLTLEEHHYRVLLAANGQEAVSHFLAHQDAIRLVLTDVMMPVMDGLELVRALRSLQPGLKVIATSGLDQDARHAELHELGVSTILLKPFTPQKLLTEIRGALDAPSA
jgi:two-component system cell cycle sensor histidine kinase/response regulator CckA